MVLKDKFVQEKIKIDIYTNSYKRVRLKNQYTKIIYYFKQKKTVDKSYLQLIITVKQIRSFKQKLF